MLKKPVITECPRDAMQGLHKFIPSQIKADYINSLLKVGFDIIDFGSFVSPNAVPQLKDSAEVLEKLDLGSASPALMALTGNIKGALNASAFDEITFLGFPFSISPTFLKLNINAGFDKALRIIDEINNLCVKRNKKLKVYLAMAFGNPYGDESNPEIVLKWTEVLNKAGIKYITLSDITGVSNKDIITTIYSGLFNDFKNIEFGFHLHTSSESWYDKVGAAWKSGCRSFDSVINGMGGCPTTGYELVGNLNTINLINYFDEQKIKTSIDKTALDNAVRKNTELIMPFQF